MSKEKDLTYEKQKKLVGCAWKDTVPAKYCQSIVL